MSINLISNQFRKVKKYREKWPSRSKNAISPRSSRTKCATRPRSICKVCATMPFPF